MMFLVKARSKLGATTTDIAMEPSSPHPCRSRLIRINTRVRQIVGRGQLSDADVGWSTVCVMGMSMQMLWHRYGHHHPDFQNLEASARDPRERRPHLQHQPKAYGLPGDEGERGSNSLSQGSL
jgi:hypothetical protein